MNKYEDLKNCCLAIGSLPHNSVDEAMNIVRQYFYDIPFCPQLPNLSKKEDMIIQYLENMPGIVFSDDKVYFDTQQEFFADEVKQLNSTYENNNNLDFYGLSENYSKCFSKFLEIVSQHKPKYAKIQVTGPFTLAINLSDKNGMCAYFNDAAKDVIVKTLVLKTIWQINQIKNISPNTTPIVFIDEPTLSHLENSSYDNISKTDVVKIITKVSKTIQNMGALSAIHCCGKCNWSIPIEIGVDIINFDAFSYAENMCSYTDYLDKFLKSNGKIVWGIVPTLDKQALTNTNIQELEQKLSIAKSYLINNGIDKDLIDNNSLISSSCGCGSLSVELAEKALKLTKELSDKLKG